MNFRSIGSDVAATAVMFVCTALIFAPAASAQSSSASHVMAEMTQGRLSPGSSNAGDVFTVRLVEDLKSNGDVVLKRGSLITGIIRRVKHAEENGTRSMIEIEWVAPAIKSRSVQDVSIALQSFIKVNSAHSSEPDDEAEFPVTLDARPARTPARTNAALLRMPSVMTIDQQTSSAIESNLTGVSSGPLFRIGRGQFVSPGGASQSIEMFSHLDNDTVMTSGGKEFEISAGTQMQLLVGVNRTGSGRAASRR